jgi:PKD repeat protein
MRFPVLRSFRLAVLSYAVLGVALLDCAAQAATRTVTISNFEFTDASSGNSTTTINAGDSVNWVWSGGFHSTTSGSCSGGCTPDGKWDSGVKSSGAFSRTFDTIGSFPYYCTVHGSMMRGTIVVQAAAAAPTANFLFQPSTPTIGTQVNFTDTSSGSPTSWLWNFGDPASGTSNTSTLQNPSHTFLSAGTYSVSLAATNSSGSGTTSKSITASNGGGVPCVPSTQNLCLNNGRFEVTTEYATAAGASGHGTGVKLTDDSGYFWFFSDTNIEVVVKVLSFCFPPFNSYAVFSAGLTDVGVTLTVRDSQTGAVYSSGNPLTTPGTVYVTQPATSAFPSSCP